MMRGTTADLLASISAMEADLARMRRMLRAAPARHSKRRWLYTAEEAAFKKQEVDFAYLIGQLSYDRRRGIKAAITRFTEGWLPPSQRVW